MGTGDAASLLPAIVVSGVVVRPGVERSGLPRGLVRVSRPLGFCAAYALPGLSSSEQPRLQTRLKHSGRHAQTDHR